MLKPSVKMISKIIAMK